MASKHSGPYNLSCPFEDVNEEPCEKDITVWVAAGYGGSYSEPPYEAIIDDIEAPCGHGILLLTGKYDGQLWRQIESRQEEAYEDAMEARYERERDRWMDD